MKMKEAEYATRTRLMRIVRALLDSPKVYTMNALADKYGVHRDTINGDFEAIKNAGFVLDKDDRHRYFFVVDKPLKQLKDLLHFSEEDQALLFQAIDQLPGATERNQNLKKKLGTVYDFGRLGHSYLRKPYLTKVDLLEQAKDQKKQVVLVNYRSSNSNTVRNRTVEAFHISASEDTIQTFDLEKKVANHFRISRFQRVEILEQSWQYEGHHNVRRTDPFRIVNNDQVNVHLRLSIGACNELLERFPLTKSYIEESEVEGLYDFQCSVNRQYLGLSNFILGFYHQGIEILGPEELKVHLKQVVEGMRF